MARKDQDGTPQSQERPNDRAVYIISVAAELAGVHPQTLRIYERKGLLRPARTAGNTRRYSERDIQRLQLIQNLTQQHGLNLAGVQMILDMEDQLDRMRRRMERLDRELEQARDRMEEQIARLQRQSSSGQLVPLSSLRSVVMEIGRPSRGQAMPASGSSRGQPIPMGPPRGRAEYRDGGDDAMTVPDAG